MRSQGIIEKNSVSENTADPIRTMIEAKVILAPMAGITDPPFRMMARRYGCKFAFTEMIDVNGIFYKNLKTLRLLESAPEDSPLGVQIVGEDEKTVVHAGKICQEKGFPVLDLNAACPVHKVTRAGKGSALLKDTAKLAKLVRGLVKNLTIPVTVKMRSGWDKNTRNYLEAAKAVAGEGASAIFVHSRTQEEMYKGKPDHEVAREIKNAVTIPVFASGNIFTPEDVDRVLELTGCDAVLIARGALGKPWIFEDMYAHFSGKEVQGEASLEKIKKAMIEHFDLSARLDCSRWAFARMYKHVSWYLKRFKKLEVVMKEYRTVKNIEALKAFVNRLSVDERNHINI